ncbi:hypothetical protein METBISCDRAFT_25366 [Metschnikowia bicuspidata]|uniref:SET domain-containing protein n=1 Tax=Metschnikowia bicuspidata TaxID=27322 RepID=A0A4P9ZID5_9ASCO|nr:hypothetical protein METBISCDRAFT_25366 [Metschnikowia bicuspidata]
MSSTLPNKVANVLQWLNENAFWNSELLDVRESQFGGVGVFWTLGPEADTGHDSLLLRIPKLAVLSPKNSFLYPLLVDYELINLEVDFTTGMESLVLTYIYEKSLQERSPWHLYFESFSDSGVVPICLWSDGEKKLLFNSECDLLGMLDASELANFYLESVKFAKEMEKFVPVPEILKSLLGEDSEKSQATLLKFGQCVQSVISRAFTVDKYHGLSLVPGADLFNHLLPVLEDNVIKPRENVHFVCDHDEDLCEECGEIGCSHLEDEDESEENGENEDNDPDSDAGAGNGIDLDTENGDLNELGSEGGSVLGSGEKEVGEGQGEGEMDLCEELTVAMVDEMENEDGETDRDDEEISTLSLNENEELSLGKIADPAQAELAEELLDGSKCCDIVLTRSASAEYNYELFNTYGNNLSNAYLMQRYGFVCPDNPNLTCNLSITMFAYLKKERGNSVKKKQLREKLDWYEEIGFDLVSEACAEMFSKAHQHHSHENSRGDEGCENGSEDGCGDDCEEDDEDQLDLADTWQLSPRIGSDAKPTLQTVALIQLLTMPYKAFLSTFLNIHSERKLTKRVHKYLVLHDLTVDGKKVLKTWVIERLRRYKDTKEVKSARAAVICLMIQEEKKLLLKALSMLPKSI